MENDYEQHEDNVSFLVENDYLQEYLSLFSFLRDKDRNLNSNPPGPRSFSERYSDDSHDHQLDASKFSEAEREKIKNLDELSAEANNLLSETTINIKALIQIAIEAGEICKLESEQIDQFKALLKE